MDEINAQLPQLALIVAALILLKELFSKHGWKKGNVKMDFLYHEYQLK